jgi:TRAP-type mannitol/chloroaromatic compound transport system permease large subunit
VPGLILVGLYAAYVLVVAWLRPGAAPAMKHAPDLTMTARDRWTVLLNGLVAPGALVVSVLGSILAGIATPTEAAGVGAVGATLLAGLRARPDRAGLMLAGVAAAIALLVLNRFFNLLLLREDFSTTERVALWVSFGLVALTTLSLATALWSVFRLGILRPVVESTARICGMIFAILVGASLFALTFRGLGGEETVHHMLSSLPGGLTGAMIFVMALMFLMGFFLDFLEIVFILVPIVGPALILLGADPVWLGVMIAINLQTSFLTPPFGFALFFLRGVAPPDVRTSDIYTGIIPFVWLQLAMLVVLALFPALATALPRLLLG